MALAPTNLSPDDQMRNMLVYDDSIAAGGTMEVTGGTIEDNLHAIISQLNRIINATTAGFWYTDINTPSSFEGGAQRGVNLLNTDLHNIERKRILKRVSAIALDVPVSVAASGTLTGSANFSNTETVTIDVKTYTFQTTLTNVDGNVQIGVDLATSLANLAGAINLTGVAGTDYATATTIHPTAFASAITATTLVATAKTQGTGGNTIATTETSATASWGGATMSGGGGTTAVVVLANSQLPSITTAAVGAVTTQGVVVATATTFGTAGLDEVVGANALQPKNLWILVNSATGDPLSRTGGVADDTQVYGLAQSQSATDGSTITGGSGNGLQISLVVRKSTGDDLELITSGDVPASVTFDYAYVRRDAFEDCPEEAWLGGGFVDSGVATATRQAAYDNQGAGIVTTTTNATLDIGGGFIWEIGDSASAPLITFTEAGAASTVVIASGVGTYTNIAADVNFTNGIQVDTSDTINLGITANQIDFTAAGTVTSTSGSTMTFTAAAANATLSTTGASGNVVVSSVGSMDMDAVGTVTIDSSGAGVSIDGAGASNFSTSSGTMTVTATAGNTAVSGLNASITSLNAATAGDVTLTAGNSSGATTAGGDVFISTGDGTGAVGGTMTVTTGDGTLAGDITFQSGTGTVADGSFLIDMGCVLTDVSQADPNTGTTVNRTQKFMIGHGNGSTPASEGDAHVILNHEWTADSETTGGMISIRSRGATAATTSVAAGGVESAATNGGINPLVYVTEDDGANFSVGEFVLLTGMNLECNNGLYEIASIANPGGAPDEITLRGVGTGTDTVREWDARNLVTDSTAAGSMTNVNICVFRCSNGTWFVADDDNADDMTFFAVGTAASSTLQAAYEAGNTIVTDGTNGAFDVSGTQAFCLDGGAASNVTVTGASADLTLSTGNTTVAGDVLVTAGTSSTATTVGGGVTVTAGGGATTGAGGPVSVTGGTGGATDGSLGGDVTISGGVSSATNGTGGAVLIDGGAESGTGAEGAISIGSLQAGAMLIGVNGGGTRIADSMALGSTGTMSMTSDGVMSQNANASLDVNVTGAYTLDATTT